MHASPWRLRLLGLAAMLGQPLFGWIWSSWLEQPYENLWLRGLMSLLGTTLLLPGLSRDFSNPATRVLVTLVMWIEIPLFSAGCTFATAAARHGWPPPAR